MELTSHQLQQLAETALDAAEAAAEYIESQVNEYHQISHKSGIRELATQVVTAIDIESQKLILSRLSDSIALYDLGLLTEELPDDGSRFIKDYFWSIDPLDGTLPFTEQKPGYAVSLALISQTGRPILAVVVDPREKRSYLAVDGQGCWIDGKPYQFQSTGNDQLVWHFDQGYLASEYYSPTVKFMEIVKEQLGFRNMDARIAGGAVMNTLNLLQAQAGCYFKFPKPNQGGGCIWDYAATSLIYQELGLYVSDIFGKPLLLNKADSPYMNRSGVIYATDAKLQKALIEMYKAVEDQI